MRPTLLFSLLVAAPVAAQSAASRALTLGLGGGGYSTLGGPHVALYVSTQRGPWAATVRGSLQELRRIRQGDFLHEQSVLEGSVMAGRVLHSGERLTFAVSSGVAAVYVQRGGGECFPSFDRVCLVREGPAPRGVAAAGWPLEARVSAQIGREFGVGLRGFANVNAVQSFGGIGVDVQIYPRPRHTP